MGLYRKKPIIIEAEQFFAEKEPWPLGVRSKEEGAALNFFIDTLEGTMEVIHGDWIITGIKGEKYPCKPDIFEQTYDRIEES